MIRSQKKRNSPNRFMPKRPIRREIDAEVILGITDEREQPKTVRTLSGDVLKKDS